MIRSLYLYTKYSVKVISNPYRSMFFDEMGKYLSAKNGFIPEMDLTEMNVEQSLQDAISWLIHSGNNSSDAGMGSFHLADGWTTSYPETTGYIIPTLLSYSKEPPVANVALKAADWLVGIQKPSGGWQGGRVADNRTEIVFNTGQVIRGMLAAYKMSDDKKYLHAAGKASDWLCDIQHAEGYWKKHALMEEARVYDSFVDAPLIEAGLIMDNKKYIEASCKNLEWIIDTQQAENGWFGNCDNTVKHADRPILHTIAYTMDGLMDCGLLLKEKKYIDAAIRAAAELLKILDFKGYLYGRFDKDWNGSEWPILTGMAQTSMVWMKIFSYKKDHDFLSGAEKLLKQLLYLQKRGAKGDKNTQGAISGSYPLWGKYEPFAFPNWATKFFADALMYYINLKKN